MKHFIFTLKLNFSMFFFSIAAIVGTDYTGSSEYYIVMLSLGVLCFVSILKSYFFHNAVPLRKVNLFFYLLPILTTLIYLIESPTTDNGYLYFSVYLAYCFPAIYIGTFVSSNRLLGEMAKWWELILVVITIGIIVSLPKMIYLNFISLGGGLSYQTISYISAFAFSLSLFSLLFGDKYPRFYFFKSKFFRYFTYLIMFFQVVAIFITGGRGGFLVLFFSSGILILTKLRNGVKFKKVIILIILTTVFFFIISYFLSDKAEYLLEIGSERIFSFITPNGIDMSNTSGRDEYYFKAIKLIKDRPIFGYGIFKYVDTSIDYPHNIFLEFLLQGGVFYFLFWIIILIKFYVKFKRILKFDYAHLILIPITIYPFTQLMFSGTYLKTALFWFVIAYVFNYKPLLKNK